MYLLDSQVRGELPVNLVVVGLMVLLENQVEMEILDHKGFLGFLDLLVQQVLKDDLVHEVKLVHLVHEVSQAETERQDFQVLSKALLDIQVHKDQGVYLVILGVMELQEDRGILV